MDAYSEFVELKNALRKLFMTVAEELGIPKLLDWLLKRLKPSETAHLSRGLSVFVSGKNKLLCWCPGIKEHDRAAKEMWRVHTDDRLRQRISERLVTKGD